jgi:hypothetical protein
MIMDVFPTPSIRFQLTFSFTIAKEEHSDLLLLLLLLRSLRLLSH